MMTSKDQAQAQDQDQDQDQYLTQCICEPGFFFSEIEKISNPLATRRLIQSIQVFSKDKNLSLMRDNSNSSQQTGGGQSAQPALLSLENCSDEKLLQYAMITDNINSIPAARLSRWMREKLSADPLEEEIKQLITREHAALNLLIISAVRNKDYRFLRILFDIKDSFLLIRMYLNQWCLNLAQADLHKFNLSDTNLSYTDLSGANLSEANLSNTKLICAKLRAAIRAANLSKANLSGADLSIADLTGANLSSANLSNARLFEANLFCTDLSTTDLTGANVSKANLSGANLPRAILAKANLSGFNLSGLNLSGADLSGANLGSATLGGTDLSFAHLAGANLSGANLVDPDANLYGADLLGADLSGADLSGADLSFAYLIGANLSKANCGNAKFNEYTIFPTEKDKLPNFLPSSNDLKDLQTALNKLQQYTQHNPRRDLIKEIKEHVADEITQRLQLLDDDRKKTLTELASQHPFLLLVPQQVTSGVGFFPRIPPSAEQARLPAVRPSEDNDPVSDKESNHGNPVRNLDPEDERDADDERREQQSCAGEKPRMESSIHRSGR